MISLESHVISYWLRINKKPLSADARIGSTILQSFTPVEGMGRLRTPGGQKRPLATSYGARGNERIFLLREFGSSLFSFRLS
jgi:hypothetical protein